MRAPEERIRMEFEAAKLIEDTLGFTNGWAVPEHRYSELCREAAKKIVADAYLAGDRNRAKRDSELAAAAYMVNTFGNWKTADQIRNDIARAILEDAGIGGE